MKYIEQNNRSVNETSKKYNMHRNIIYNWKRTNDNLN